MTWWLLKPLGEFSVWFLCSSINPEIGLYILHCFPQLNSNFRCSQLSEWPVPFTYFLSRLTLLNIFKNLNFYNFKYYKILSGKIKWNFVLPVCFQFHGDGFEMSLRVPDTSLNDVILISRLWGLGRLNEWILQFMSYMSSSHTDWTQHCGPALLACRSVDALITRESLTQDKSERFHLCRWVASQSLVTGLALAN